MGLFCVFDFEIESGFAVAFVNLRLHWLIKFVNWSYWLHFGLVTF